MKKTFTKASLVDILQRMVRQRFGTFVALSKTTKFTDLKFDKYDVLYVVMATEEICQIEITPEEMTTINVFGDLTNIACAKLKNECRLTDVRQEAKKEVKENTPVLGDDGNFPEVDDDNPPQTEELEEELEEELDEPAQAEPEKSIEEQQKEFAASEMAAEEASVEKEKSLAEQQAEFAKEQQAQEAAGETEGDKPEEGAEVNGEPVN